MAIASRPLVRALLDTAQRLEGGASYRWTHMGACNCGHLAQTVTKRSPAEIHRVALEKAGDWHQQVLDHCPASGLPMDDIIEALLAIGLDRDDLAHLERLCDPAVLQVLPLGQRSLDHRRREDVVRYLRAMALRLESSLPSIAPARTPALA